MCSVCMVSFYVKLQMKKRVSFDFIIGIFTLAKHKEILAQEAFKQWNS